MHEVQHIASALAALVGVIGPKSHPSAGIERMKALRLLLDPTRNIIGHSLRSLTHTCAPKPEFSGASDSSSAFGLACEHKNYETGDEEMGGPK